MSALGSNIKFLRERHDITPLAMSKKLKISLQDYNAWESGLSLPTINNVMDICAVYGLKNPTDLFSESFVQIYNATEIKTVKEVARRKAEAKKLAADSAETKLNFMVKEGSYYGNTNYFGISICLAIAILIALFLPCFIVDEKPVIGYLAVSSNIIYGIVIYLVALIALFVIFAGTRANYKILEGNEFMTKHFAILLKLLYVITGLLVGALTLFVYFSYTTYEYGLTVFTGVSLVYMVFALFSALSIKAAGKDAVTYAYVIKFSKYKLRTDRPRKLLKALSIIGLILTIVAVALGVVQLVMDKVLLVDQIGMNNGIIGTITTGFYAILPYLTDTLFKKIVVCLVVALVIATTISNIAVSNKVQKTDYNGYLKDDQTKRIRRHLAVNLALDVVTYAIAYALILVTLTDSVEGTKLIYEYYLIPILTIVSLFVALKYLVYPKVYGAFRGAETYELTGFSEVKLDEEKRQKKLAKKSGGEAKESQTQNSEQTEKPKKEKKEKVKKDKKKKGEEEPSTEPNTTDGGNA